MEREKDRVREEEGRVWERRKAQRRYISRRVDVGTVGKRGRAFKWIPVWISAIPSKTSPPQSPALLARKFEKKKRTDRLAAEWVRLDGKPNGAAMALHGKMEEGNEREREVRLEKELSG